MPSEASTQSDVQVSETHQNTPPVPAMGLFIDVVVDTISAFADAINVRTSPSASENAPTTTQLSAE